MDTTGVSPVVFVFWCLTRLSYFAGVMVLFRSLEQSTCRPEYLEQ